jgi:hypothetical protein
MKLQKGDIIELELVRVPIYANAKHVPSFAESTKQFLVSGDYAAGYALRSLKEEKKIRGWVLSRSLEYLNSHTKPPLRYEVLQVTLLDDD